MRYYFFSRMNILIYFENVISPQRGGTERAAYNIARILKENGHNIFTLARYKSSAMLDLNVSFFPNECMSAECNKQFLCDFIKENQIDVLINEGGNTADSRFLNHRELTIDCIIITCLHFSVFQGYSSWMSDSSGNPIQKLISFLYWPIRRRKALSYIRDNYLAALNWTDSFVVLSDFYKKELLRFCKAKDYDDKVCTIPNPSSFSIESVYNKEKMVLWVGRLQYKTKRVDRLLKAWRICQNKFPDWTLVIVGDGPDKHYYERATEKLKDERVIFTGHQSPESYYSRASIISLVSTHEGMPMTIIEGMSKGCVPIMFSSFPTAYELIDDGKDGMLIEPFKINSFARGLQRLMSDETRRIKMSQNALVKATRFTSEKIGLEWERLFSKIT